MEKGICLVQYCGRQRRGLGGLLDSKLNHHVCCGPLHSELILYLFVYLLLLLLSFAQLLNVKVQTLFLGSFVHFYSLPRS